MLLSEITSLPKYGSVKAPKHVTDLALDDDADKATINWYSGHGYSPMNAQLRGHEPQYPRGSDHEMAKDYGAVLSNDEGIARLDRIIASQPRKQSIKVYRGETNNEITKRYLDMSVGQSHIDKGFLSTTFDASRAFYSFAQLYQMHGRGSNAISMYRVPVSVKGAFMSLPGETPIEQEFVIQRNCRYTLVEKRQLPVRNKNYPIKEITLLVWDVSPPLNEEVEYHFSDGPETFRTIKINEPDLFHSKRIKYMDSKEMQKEKHFVAMLDGQTVGMAGVQVNPDNGQQLWIKFISVDPAYQGQGIAKQLLRMIYKYASQKGLKMAPGSFSPEGERLRHLHDLWDKEYPDVAYSRDKKGNYLNGKGQIVRRFDESIQWSNHTLGRDQIVYVDAEKVRASWQKDKYFYFDGDDHPNAIRGRIQRFNSWIQKGEAVNPPEICLDDAGNVVFTNGRHRFVWMLQHGETTIPVAVPPEYVEEVRERFA